MISPTLTSLLSQRRQFGLICKKDVALKFTWKIVALFTENYPSNKRFIPYCQPKSINFTKPFLVGQCRDVLSEPFKSVVNRLHPFPLSQVSRVTLMNGVTQWRLPVWRAQLPFRHVAIVVVVVIVEGDDGVAAWHHRWFGFTQTETQQ